MLVEEQSERAIGAMRLNMKRSQALQQAQVTEARTIPDMSCKRSLRSSKSEIPGPKTTG